MTQNVKSTLDACDVCAERMKIIKGEKWDHPRPVLQTKFLLHTEDVRVKENSHNIDKLQALPFWPKKHVRLVPSSALEKFAKHR